MQVTRNDILKVHSVHVSRHDACGVHMEGDTPTLALAYTRAPICGYKLISKQLVTLHKLG